MARPAHGSGCACWIAFFGHFGRRARLLYHCEPRSSAVSGNDRDALNNGTIDLAGHCRRHGRRGRRCARSRQPPHRAEVWDLELGTPAAALPSAFGEYACGTNGGPPSLPLSGWGDFRRCRPEPSGLREVYFRYDDELEYWAKANDLPTEIERYSGTKVYDFPGGAVGAVRRRRHTGGPAHRQRSARHIAPARRSLRAAQFPHRPLRPRRLGLHRPAASRRRGAGRPDLHQAGLPQNHRRPSLAVMQTRYFRKKGQNQFDPHSSKETEGQFESMVHFELTLAK